MAFDLVIGDRSSLIFIQYSFNQSMAMLFTKFVGMQLKLEHLLVLVLPLLVLPPLQLGYQTSLLGIHEGCL